MNCLAQWLRHSIPNHSSRLGGNAPLKIPNKNEADRQFFSSFPIPSLMSTLHDESSGDYDCSECESCPWRMVDPIRGIQNEIRAFYEQAMHLATLAQNKFTSKLPLRKQQDEDECTLHLVTVFISCNEKLY